VRITVFAGSSRAAAQRHFELARELGAEIARRGHELVYGGGRTGLMGALADGALAAGGRVRGVILKRFIDEDVHHMGIEMFSVEDMRSRKAGLDERADAYGDGFWQPLLDLFERAIADGFEEPAARSHWAVARTPAEAVAICEKP
jgi:predicted Rossmann-fold nucleotide-binding protein